MLKLDISGRMKSPWDGDYKENHVLLKPVSGFVAGPSARSFVSC